MKHTIKSTWVKYPWIIDRRTWIMYLIINELSGRFGELAKIGPDKNFFNAISEHVDSFIHEGVMPPEKISSAILNIADDVLAGRDVTIKAGDYIALQDFIQHSK